MRHVELIESIKRSLGRRVVKRDGVDRGIGIKKLYLVVLEFFFFSRDVRLVPLGFVFFGDSFDRNGMAGNDGIGGAG